LTPDNVVGKDRANPHGLDGMRHRLTGLDFGVAVLIVLLAAATGLVVAAPNIALVVTDTQLDLVINTAAVLAAIAVSALAFARFREVGQTEALYQSSAFLVLAVLNALVLAAILTNLEDEVHMSLANAGQLPIYVLMTGRLVASILLLLSALAAARGWPAQRQRSGLVMIAPTLGLLLVTAVAYVLRDQLPPLVGTEALDALRVGPTVTSILPGVGLPLLITQIVVGAIYLGAAYLYLRLPPGAGVASTPFLAIGLVIAAFSQVHFALHPGAYAPLVSTGDLLRVGFYAILLLGIDVERRSDLRAVRRAHGELRRLREAELAAAALEERARLAREVHDGLAQDLWYAKLKQGRLLQSTTLDTDARQLADDVSDAIDSALAEARQAVMAMRPQLGGSSFEDVLSRYVEDFGDRFGVRTELDVPDALPSLPPRVQAELLRILQEALNNVRRHADATVVRVQISNSQGQVRFAVTDNGRGFEPADVDASRYGLQSMRERAASIGAQFEIHSRPQDGTRVAVAVPVPGATR
jgi:signal transduction histidine kinase